MDPHSKRHQSGWPLLAWIPTQIHSPFEKYRNGMEDRVSWQILSPTAGLGASYVLAHEETCDVRLETKTIK